MQTKNASLVREAFFGFSLRAKLSFYLLGGFSAAAVLPAPMSAEGLSEECCSGQVISRRDRKSRQLDEIHQVVLFSWLTQELIQWFPYLTRYMDHDAFLKQS